jgi:hypothetical protein
MFYKLRSFLSFLWKSGNEHSVHSPFVFNFITKGLYNKQADFDLEKYPKLKNLNKREKEILSKIFNYFSRHTIYVDVKEIDLETRSIFYFSSLDNIAHLNPKNNDSFLILRGIHQDKTTVLRFKRLVENDFVTLSIDLYYFGLLFFRKEQAKEYFIIRT